MQIIRWQLTSHLVVGRSTIPYRPSPETNDAISNVYGNCLTRRDGSQRSVKSNGIKEILRIPKCWNHTQWYDTVSGNGKRVSCACEKRNDATRLQSRPLPLTRKRYRKPMVVNDASDKVLAYPVHHYGYYLCYSIATAAVFHLRSNSSRLPERTVRRSRETDGEYLHRQRRCCKYFHPHHGSHCLFAQQTTFEMLRIVWHPDLSCSIWILDAFRQSSNVDINIYAGTKELGL